MFRHSRLHPRVHVVGWDLGWHASRAVRRVVFGAALILLGVGSLLKAQGLVAADDLWLVAPLVIALSGVVRLVVAPGLASLGRAVLRFALAGYLVMVIEHVGGWTLAATWPLLLIAGGVAMVAQAVFARRLREEPHW